ncbi:MAG: hypothetical protein A3F13_07480 [Gammaproteobacteria bacterium RIFCSPHIGHO2_12_FULL_40_19]|nr:MAG: hypothetical protein A3F13_07480 [Gammaproteobacteria bacterium RIFCSPHIGHO2_12_FULL_40_19]
MIKGLISSYLLYPIAERMEKRDIRNKLKSLYRYYSQPFLFREAMMKKTIYNQVAHANQKVPYYRDLFKTVKFNPESLLKDIQYLNEVPFLDKNIILEQGDRLLVDDYAKYKDHPCKTGGSTGKSVIIHYDQDAADWSAATTLYARNSCGNKRYKKELHLSSELPVIRTGKDKFREDLKCLSMNRKNVFYKTFDDESIHRLLREIKKSKSHLVHGHPSTMYTLAVAAKKQNAQKKLFSVFESSGEYLPVKKAEAIQETFDCNIINRYGLAEAGVIAYQLGKNTEELFLFDHMVFAESVLDEIVITNLKNNFMPLLRYKTGDLGDVKRTEGGYYIDHLRGRVHDSVTINGKVYLTHYIQDLLDRFGGVSDFQILVKENTPPVLRVVMDEYGNKENLEKEVRAIFHDLPIEYISMHDLKLVGRRHKFRYVVSELS